MKLFITGLLLVLGIQSALSQDNTTRLAWEYYNKNDYAKAAPLFLKIYEENNVSTYLHYYINCLIETRDYETAIKTVKKEIRRTKDVNLNIELGYIYELSGDSKKADECYQEPMTYFPTSAAGIINLGNVYSSFAKYQYAETVFSLGRKLLGNSNEFRMELANVYYAERRFPEMLEEYYNLILTDSKYLPSVQAMIQNAMANDVDQTLLQLTREKTSAFIQKWPGIPTFYEMLIWVLCEEKKFMEAVDQAIAMDRRNQTLPDKVLQIARQSTDAGDSDAALKAYQYLIEKGPTASKPVYNLARVESLLTLSEKMQNSPATQSEQWKRIAGDFRTAITDLGQEPVSGPLYIKLAHIQAFCIQDYAEGLKTIEEALALPGRPPLYRSTCLLEKADILLSSGDPWEASLVYSMVDMENPDNPEGSAARFRKAQLSWFTGNYKWAMSQLDILKGSTSKLNANDALELSILIRENISDTDSTQTTLPKLSKADYLLFRNMNDQALLVFDSIISDTTGSPAIDDCLYKKAHILLDRNNLEQAIAIFSKIIENYRYEYWGHKALYELACIYQDRLNDSAKAISLFEEFIRDFPTSFYFLNARDRLKALKS
ncbi:MAG: tetratricopeptide repeat protein [Bacteroidales bacterium]|nr:tetratricopeptide repeat protein [Bacteroidales bacterium]